MEAIRREFNLTCTKCGEGFTIVSSTGPVLTCGVCFRRDLAAFWAMFGCEVPGAQR